MPGKKPLNPSKITLKPLEKVRSDKFFNFQAKKTVTKCRQTQANSGEIIYGIAGTLSKLEMGFRLFDFHPATTLVPFLDDSLPALGKWSLKNSFRNC